MRPDLCIIGGWMGKIVTDVQKLTVVNSLMDSCIMFKQSTFEGREVSKPMFNCIIRGKFDTVASCPDSVGGNLTV
jgi:hypothetical protein